MQINIFIFLQPIGIQLVCPRLDTKPMADSGFQNINPLNIGLRALKKQTFGMLMLGLAFAQRHSLHCPVRPDCVLCFPGLNWESKQYFFFNF